MNIVAHGTVFSIKGSKAKSNQEGRLKMSRKTKTAQAVSEILARFDSLPTDVQLSTCRQLRERFVESYVRSTIGTVLGDDVKLEHVLASMQASPPVPHNTGSTTRRMAGRPAGIKAARDANGTVLSTQQMVENIVCESANGIGTSSIVAKLTSQPEFHSESQGKALEGLVRNCLNRGLRDGAIRRLTRGNYGPPIAAPVVAETEESESDFPI